MNKTMGHGVKESVKESVNEGLLPDLPNEPMLNLLASLLLILYVANFFNDFMLNEAFDSLWICHMSLLLLALGLFLQKTLLVQIALLWIVPGGVLWLLDSVENNLFSLTSTLSHVGSLAIGLYALSRMRAVSHAWLYAIGFFLCLQLLSRLATPAAANINIAHGIWDGWQAMFSAYWQYWVFTTTAAIIGLWLLEKCLLKLFPAN